MTLKIIVEREKNEAATRKFEGKAMACIAACLMYLYQDQHPAFDTFLHHDEYEESDGRDEENEGSGGEAGYKDEECEDGDEESDDEPRETSFLSSSPTVPDSSTNHEDNTRCRSLIGSDSTSTNDSSVHPYDRLQASNTSTSTGGASSAISTSRTWTVDDVDDQDASSIERMSDTASLQGETSSEASKDDSASLSELDDSSLKHADEYPILLNEESGSEEENDQEELILKESAVYSGSRVTVEQAELLILLHALRNKNTQKNIDYTVQLIDLLLPRDQFKSRYRILKDVSDPDLVYYFYCIPCELLIDFNGKSTAHCKKCLAVYNMKKMKKKNQFFVYNGTFEAQLRRLILGGIYIFYRQDCAESDIVKTRFDTDLLARGVMSIFNFTVTLFTDGVKLFQNSTDEAWPLYATLNELPYRERMKNMMLLAIWYGPTKPIMNLFLKPFVDGMLILHKHGFICRVSTYEQERLIRVHTILVILDTIARAAVQHVIQFNGECGCSYCLHLGELIQVGSTERSRARVYSVQDLTLRTRAMYHEDSEKVRDLMLVQQGVKGPTVSYRLETVDPILSCAPEYMHVDCLGVPTLAGIYYSSVPVTLPRIYA
ncbi:hypothetical protein QAD02_002561 [Eretmocerus hayati]|uniref:Uncharacterized protein n=1 Tax=Eretmocerus hayati TaxID=131215 RepID=A0ACC2NJM9_9HYME|nr:hypothetical protein QAD02_002561 [Eretmocerus hayati]